MNKERVMDWIRLEKYDDWGWEGYLFSEIQKRAGKCKTSEQIEDFKKLVNEWRILVLECNERYLKVNPPTLPFIPANVEILPAIGDKPSPDDGLTYRERNELDVKQFKRDYFTHKYKEIRSLYGEFLVLYKNAENQIENRLDYLTVTRWIEEARPALYLELGTAFENIYTALELSKTGDGDIHDFERLVQQWVSIIVKCDMEYRNKDTSGGGRGRIL